MVPVGRLRRVRGNRGEFVAEIYSAQPGRAERLNEVRLELGPAARDARVEHVWYHQGRPILKFAGIDTIAEAEKWEGADVLAEPVPPPAGEYSHAGLIGCTVLVEDSSRSIGVVRAVEEFGGPALLNIEPPQGGEILVPFAREICREVDTQQKLIRAWLPEGL